MAKARKYVMIQADKKERKLYKRLAKMEGFEGVATWFRWIALKRVEFLKEEEKL